jgi:hypothetical protein
MNCPFCNTPLKSDSFATWNIGERKMTAYHCHSSSCRLAEGSFVPDKIEVDLVTPGNEIIAYTFVFTINDKWYRVYSHSGAPNKRVTKPKTLFLSYDDKIKTFSPGYNDKDVLVTMERYIPLDWDKPIEEQIETARDKLKTLLPFL